MYKIISHIRTDKPEIIGLPSKLAAVEGQRFTFPSHVTGKPVPSVYWYLNSRYVNRCELLLIRMSYISYCSYTTKLYP